MRLFSRRRKQAVDTDGLGVNLIALRLDAGDVAPAQSTVVVFNAAGHARRAAAGRVVCEPGEMAFCFHPGPYTVDLAPFASAPEWGLRTRFVIDAANPRVSQQRFDLYLYSETSGRLELASFGASVQMALQAELAQGALELPPCTSLEEWHAFRAGFNQLMYTRYGVTVDDCVPVDLGEQVDYAEILKNRAQEEASAGRQAAAIAADHAIAQPPAAPPSAVPAPGAATPALGAAAPLDRVAAAASPLDEGRAGTHDRSVPYVNAASASTLAFVSASQVAGIGASAGVAGQANMPVAERDARALRRLFLELPALSSGLRALTVPPGREFFQQHQSLLMRLHMAVLNVNTMPSLAWAAPDQPLSLEAQERRSASTLIAQAALDEAWSLLARFQSADPQQWPQLLDEADRICANLETGLSQRRQPHVPRMEPVL